MMFKGWISPQGKLYKCKDSNDEHFEFIYQHPKLFPEVTSLDYGFELRSKVIGLGWIRMSTMNNWYSFDLASISIPILETYLLSHNFKNVVMELDGRMYEFTNADFIENNYSINEIATNFVRYKMSKKSMVKQIQAKWQKFSESKNLQQGKEVEKEHTDVYDKIKKDVSDGTLDETLEDFTGDIAKDHLKEDKNYYDKLKEMEKKSGKEESLSLVFETLLEYIPNKDQVATAIKQHLENGKINIQGLVDEYISDERDKEAIIKTILNNNNKMEKTTIKTANLLTGSVEEIELEPELATAMEFDETPGVEDEPSIEATTNFTTINPKQSFENVKTQFLTNLQGNFPNDLTYDAIYETACGTGLCDCLDRYDLVSIMNVIAKEIGLPMIDFSQYFEDDSIDEVGDIRGHEASIGYGDEDTESDNAVGEFMEQFDNKADGLYEVDRVLSERLKLMGSNVNEVLDEGQKLVKDAFKHIKKNAMINKYTVLDVKVDKVSMDGRVINAKINYDLALMSTSSKYGQKRVSKHITVPVIVMSGKIHAPKEFVSGGNNYQIASYFINDLF